MNVRSNMAIEYDNYTTEELELVQGLFESGSGMAFMRMMNDAVQVPITSLLSTADEAERNRGQVDVYRAVTSLPVRLKMVISERRKNEKSE
jgi:hypothetical protein